MPPGALPMAFSGEPSELYVALAEDPNWKQLVNSGRRFSLTYGHRPFGQVVLEDARVDSSEPGTYRVSAQRFWLNQASYPELTFSLRKHVETIELRQEPQGDVKPLELNYTPGGGAKLWLFSLPHQPARGALAHYGLPLLPDRDPTRLLTSLSLVVPDAADKPVRGRLELVLDAWPKPDWPDTKALLGDTLSLGARVEPAEQGGSWALEDARVSLLLFTLSGQGHIDWAEPPAFALDASGERTCEQLRKNLEPSVYLDDITRFLAAQPASAAKGSVRLSVHLRVSPTSGVREIDWRLTAGCGLAAR